MSFTNNISIENKTYSETNQKCFTNMFSVASHFILLQIAPENKYQTAVAEFNLKSIGTETVMKKVKGEEQPQQVTVYYKDDPLIETKIHTAEAWKKKEEEKKNKLVKITKTTKKTAPKKEPVVVALEDGNVQVTREVARTKFMAIGKPIRHILSSILNYYINELTELRKDDILTPDTIEKEGKISKFICNVAKTMDVKNTFNSNVFGEHADAVGNKFDKAHSDLTVFLNTLLPIRLFSQQIQQCCTDSFVNFILLLIKECSIYRAKGQSINESNFYSTIISLYGRCENLGFDIKDLEKALKKDSERAINTFKKIPAKKGAGGKTPVKTVPPKKTPGKMEEGAEDFDVDGDADDV